MFSHILILLAITLLGAQACPLEEGDVMSDSVFNVTDYARGGFQKLNSTCFVPCVATKTLYINLRVALANSETENPKLLNKMSRKFTRVTKPDDYDNINEITCASSILRQEIAQNLTNVNDYSCKGIVRTLAYGLNRPKWFISCYVPGVGAGDAYSDDNFCLYHTDLNGISYTLILAAIETN